MAFGGNLHGKQQQPSLANQAEGDVDVLVRDTFFPDVASGVLVEVGAASPDFLSLGNSFRGCGWRVISVEPNPIFAEKHRALGHEIQEFACGEEDRDDVPFFLAQAKNLGFQYRGGEISYESFSSLGIRGDFKKLFDTLADRFTTQEIRVKQRRLETILEAIEDLAQVDILCIDTEGWELECVKGFPFDRFKPKALIIEDFFGRTEIDELLGSHGYVRWQRLTPNNVYVLSEAAFMPQQRGYHEPMTTYAGNLEDVLLRRCFEGVTDGFYVDIGVNSPTNASVTRWFYKQGWSGINAKIGEATDQMRDERPRDINLELSVSVRDGEKTFWVHSGNTETFSPPDVESKFVAEYAKESKPLQSRLETLTAILDEHAPGRHIQFLKVDAKGAEYVITAAANWLRHRPEVLVVESSEACTNIRVKATWQDVLEENRYHFAYFDGINDFWVREESAHLCDTFRVPINSLDTYRLFDVDDDSHVDVESLRDQVAELRAVITATQAHSDAVSVELAQLRDERAAAEASALNHQPRRGFLPAMTSYTPNLEDVLLRRCFPEVTNGFYVDVGAAHPTNASVTRWFYDQGWSGINVEPSDSIVALRSDRPRDINLELAVSDREGETTFWVHSENTYTSSLLEEVPDLVAERAGEIKPLKVRLSTLKDILDKHAPEKHIHFLKIDAEGAEDAIIAAADWSRHRPEVVVVESSEAFTNIRVKASWQDVLARNRYRFAYFDGINDFWIREESSHLLPEFQIPINVLDAYKVYDAELESLRGAAARSIREKAPLIANGGGGRQRVILFATVVPLDTSSGGTIVCREHVHRIVGTPNSDIHIFAHPGSSSCGSADFAASLGATFHPIEFSALPDERPISGHPFSMERLAMLNPLIDLRFRELVAEIRPDVIVLDYLFTALFLPSAFYSWVPVVLVTQNREQEFFHDQRKLGRVGPGAANSKLAEWRLGRFENQVQAMSDHIVVLSSHDIPRDRQQAARTTVIEPMLEENAQKWHDEGRTNVFFVGNVNHYPNFAAVQWLCESFAPALATYAPRARITIIGAEPTEAPETWKQPNVDLLGRSTAEEVLRQFTGCGLFIAPIENSFGSKIKILEALAYATPLLATAEALTGVPGSEGIPLFSLDDPKGAGQLAAGLLQQPEKLKELSSLMDNIRNINLSRSRAAWPALLEQVASRPSALSRSFSRRSFLQPRFPVAVSGPDVEVNANSRNWIGSEGMGPVIQFDGRALRWTAAEAKLTVPIDPAKPPCWLRVRTWEITPAEGTDLRVFANDTEVLSGRVFGKPFDEIVPLPPLSACCELTLRFVSPGFQTPGDDRVLGVALESVRLGQSRRKLSDQSLLRSFLLAVQSFTWSPPPVCRPVVEVSANSSDWIGSEGMGPVIQFDGRALRWTAAEANLTVPIDPTKPPCWLRVRTREITPAEGTDLRVFANDTEVLSGRVFGKPFDEIVPLPPLSACDELTLRFVSPGFQTPGDDRVLGVALESVCLSQSRLRIAAYPRLPRFIDGIKSLKRLF